MILAVTVAIVVVVFWQPMFDAFLLPKMTVVFLGMVVVATTTGVSVALTRRVTTPEWPVLILTGGFLLAMAAATLTSDHFILSLIGPRGRYTGFFPYVSYVVAFYAASGPHWSARDLRRLSQATIAATAVIVVYGFLQVGDMDPFEWRTGLPSVFSTFGNTNIAAAFAGMATAIALGFGVAEWRGPRHRWAIVAVGVSAGAAAFAVATGTVQGPVTVGFGVAVVAAVLLSNHWRQAVRFVSRNRLAVGASALVVAGLAAVLVLSVADRIENELAEGIAERGDFWRTAITIFKENPITGSGPGTFGMLFLRQRPPGHATSFGFAIADDPHNVPLAMLSHGGLLLATAYLAFVLYVGVAAVRVLRRRLGRERLLFGGIVGAWLAYQVQSLVSIDVPPLGLLHWVLAGLIVGGARAAEPLRELQLPGQPMRRVGHGRRRRLDVPRSSLVLAGTIVLFGIVAAVFATLPARAELAAHHASDLDREGRLVEALGELERATSLAPWAASYWESKAATLAALGRPDEALDAIQEAAERDSGSSRYALLVAESHAATGREEDAVRWFREALARDPNNPQVLVSAGRGLAAAGFEEEGDELIQRGQRLDQETGN